MGEVRRITMKYIVLVTILFCGLMGVCYVPLRQQISIKGSEGKREQEKGRLLLMLILILAGLVRIIGGSLYRGYEVDMNCFMAWSNMVYENGFHKFYSLDAFTDYPPGYMYVLYVLGWIRSVFQMGDGTAAVILTKMPAIIADLVTGWLIFKIAGKRINQVAAAFAAGIFLITPAIVLDSAIWGQVDSVFTVFVVLMCYLITERKLTISYFVFAIGILIKPQTLIFGPVLLFGIIDQVFIETLKKESREVFLKKFFINLGLGLAAILLIFLLIIPFGFTGDFKDSPIIKQYVDTLGSYPYASVNAYNFWALLGKNWTSQTEGFLHFSYKIWGTFFILQILVLAAFVNFRSKSRDTKYYFTGALIVIGMFTMSVRMHERYVYPAMALLLICFALKPKTENFILYVSLASVSFLNMAEVMYFYDPDHYDAHAVFPKVVALLVLLVFDFLIYVALTQHILAKERTDEMSVRYRKKQMKRHKKKQGQPALTEKEPEKVICASEKLERMGKADWIILAAVTVIYAVTAFINLGNNFGPATSMSLVKRSEQSEIIFDFGKNVTLDKIWDYLGSYNNPKYVIDYAADGDDYWVGYYTEGDPWDAGSVFCWNSKDLKVTARYIKIVPTQDTYKDSMVELAFTDADKNIILPVNYEEYANLFDEPETLTKVEQYNGSGSFKTGTYFDEIYHARTAFEMINHLYCYENTHPPLGKIFISLGIRMFGMHPFGWRFMGTLFGVMMLPVFYIFSKKMFGKTWLSASVTILFAFDFMHFAQTRIATIDVFVTFFIILMYLFMYLYTKKSFYDTPIIQTFLPLGLCGITMGLAWASKWTGIYASVGLCILFFMTMAQRYREYLYAKKHPEGTTDGIMHSEIISGFWKKSGMTIGFCVIFFLVIPAVIYTLSYLPFRDSDELTKGLIQRMLDNQQTMFNYHSTLESTHPYSSFWYEWPVMKRPIWFFSGQTAENVYQGISSFGNPLVWWAGIPAFLFVLYQWIMKKDRMCGFLTIGYLSQYLPWIFIGRVVFIYHYFPSVPFVVLMLGYCFKRFVEKKPEWKWGVYGYVLLAVLLFIVFYPVLSGADVSPSYVKTYLRWFDDWQLISAMQGDAVSIFAKVLRGMDRIMGLTGR